MKRLQFINTTSDKSDNRQTFGHQQKQNKENEVKPALYSGTEVWKLKREHEKINHIEKWTNGTTKANIEKLRRNIEIEIETKTEKRIGIESLGTETRTETETRTDTEIGAKTETERNIEIETGIKKETKTGPEARVEKDTIPKRRAKNMRQVKIKNINDTRNKKRTVTVYRLCHLCHLADAVIHQTLRVKMTATVKETNERAFARLNRTEKIFIFCL